MASVDGATGQEERGNEGRPSKLRKPCRGL